MAAQSKTLGSPFQADVKYQNYKSGPQPIPSSAVDQMTPELGTYTAATTFSEYEETKYIVYN